MWLIWRKISQWSFAQLFFQDIHPRPKISSLTTLDCCHRSICCHSGICHPGMTIFVPQADGDNCFGASWAARAARASWAARAARTAWAAAVDVKGFQVDNNLKGHLAPNPGNSFGQIKKSDHLSMTILRQS